MCCVFISFNTYMTVNGLICVHVLGHKILSTSEKDF